MTLKDSDSILPQELAGIWGDELAADIAGLSFNHQTFLFEYIRTGNGRKSYQKAYPGSDEANASARSSGLVNKGKVSEILQKIKDLKTKVNLQDFFAVHATLYSALEATKPVFGKDENGAPDHVMDVEDWDARLKATAQLAKISGLNAPEKVQDDRFTALVNLMQTRGRNGKEKA